MQVAMVWDVIFLVTFILWERKFKKFFKFRFVLSTFLWSKFIVFLVSVEVKTSDKQGREKSEISLLLNFFRMPGKIYFVRSMLTYEMNAREKRVHKLQEENFNYIHSYLSFH